MLDTATYTYLPLSMPVCHHNSSCGVRRREKELLLSALDFLKDHEELMANGTIVYQLEQKVSRAIIILFHFKLYIENSQCLLPSNRPIEIFKLSIFCAHIFTYSFLSAGEGSSRSRSTGGGISEVPGRGRDCTSLPVPLTIMKCRIDEFLVPSL